MQITIAIMTFRKIGQIGHPTKHFFYYHAAPMSVDRRYKPSEGYYAALDWVLWRRVNYNLLTKA